MNIAEWEVFIGLMKMVEHSSEMRQYLMLSSIFNVLGLLFLFRYESIEGFDEDFFFDFEALFKALAKIAIVVVICTYLGFILGIVLTFA